MKRVRAGDVVLVHFRGRLDDGSEFGSSAGRGPIRFTAAGRDMIPGLSGAYLRRAFYRFVFHRCARDDKRIGI